MKNKVSIRCFLICLFCFATSFLYSQIPITFQKVMGGSGDRDYFKSVIQVYDGGYVAAGYTNSDISPGEMRVVLSKTNINGIVLWTKIFGGSVSEECYSVIETTDSGLVITGRTYSFGPGGGDIFLLKTDKDGNLLWSNTYGESGFEEAYSITESYDGGLLITGRTSSYRGVDDMYLIKTDQGGNLLWSKIYGGPLTDVGHTVIETADTGIALAGYTLNYGAGSFDMYLVRADRNGNLLWTKTYGGAGQDRMMTTGHPSSYNLIETSDGGFAMIGYTMSYGTGITSIYLIKTDNNGSLLWTKTYGGIGGDVGFAVAEDNDGGLIIIGWGTSFGNTSYQDAYIIKTDNVGNILVSKTIGELDHSDYFFSFAPTTDGGYIFAGATHNWNADPLNNFEDEFFLVKTDGQLNSGCNEFLITPDTSSGGVEGTGGTDSSVTTLVAAGMISIPLIVFDTLTNCYNRCAINLDLGNDTSICDTPFILDAGMILGVSYLWSTGDTTQTIAVNSSGQYWVNISDSNCAGNDTINIYVSNLSVNIGNDTSICQGNSVTLNAGTPGLSYLWSASDTSQMITVSGADTYFVAVNDSGCIRSDTMILSVSPLPLSLGNDTSFCIGDSMLLDAGGVGETYLWSTGDTTSSIWVSVQDTYWVVKTDMLTACSNIDSIGVTQVNPVIDLGSDISICPNETVTLDATYPGASYLWSTTEISAMINVSQPGSYIATINVSGCMDSDTINIGKFSEDSCVIRIFIPNTFSPNNDGVNDFHQVRSLGDIQTFNIVIYDRWGISVYESDNHTIGWDGKYKGKDLDPGTFAYYVKVEFPKETIVSQGTVTLLR